MPTKPTKPTTSASVKTHENMTPTTPTPTTPPSAAETLEARAARAHAAATASAVAAGRAADLRQEATERLQEEVARLEDLQRDERALDARIASDLAAIETARQRVADLPEAVARAKMSATIHAGTILESRSTKQTAELGVEHERLTDQITIWDQTAQARSSAEVEQRERLYDLRCRAEEAITTLQQQLARID
ncbi:MAG TPA: hypothetical protein VF916_07640, partial [Ktedonobacterales bacterium]